MGTDFGSGPELPSLTETSRRWAHWRNMKMKVLNGWILSIAVGLFLGAPAANADVVGSIFLTGHDPDFHASEGGNAAGAQAINQAAISFIMDPTFNTFVAGGTKEFLFVECDTCSVPSGHVDGIPGINDSASGFPAGTTFETHGAADGLATELTKLGTKYSDRIGFRRHADTSRIGHPERRPVWHLQFFERRRRAVRYVRGKWLLLFDNLQPLGLFTFCDHRRSKRPGGSRLYRDSIRSESRTDGCGCQWERFPQRFHRQVRSQYRGYGPWGGNSFSGWQRPGLDGRRCT